MRNFLKGKGLWKYVTGEKTCPKKLEDQKVADFESKVEEWEMNNSKIVTWIANTVTTSISMQLGKFETAKEVWDFLARRYVQTDFARRSKLELDLASLKQKTGQSISDFHSEMLVLWDQLALMEPKWTVDAELYYQYREETRLVQFLMALQDDFESIRSSILHRIPRPSVDATLSELLAEETRKGILIHKGTEAESVFIATQHTKYSTQSSNSFGNNQGKYKDMSTVECRYCHKFGHMKSNCPELKGRYNPRKSNRTAALASSESESLATTSQSSQLSSDHPTADQVQEMIKQAFSCMGNDSNVASAFSVNSGSFDGEASWDRP
ncbi:Zinc finger, CCHC-type [Fagus crenata]